MRLRHDAPFRAKKGMKIAKKNPEAYKGLYMHIYTFLFSHGVGKVRTLLIRAYLVIVAQFSRATLLLLLLLTFARKKDVSDFA